MAVGGSKAVLKGVIGSYTWADVSFTNDLAKIAWSAKAPAKTACAVAWRLEPGYSDAIGGTVKASAGKSVSGSRQIDSSYLEGSLTVKSTCPGWSLTLTSYAKPKYWNPWGYNFTPGTVITNPPSDFCGYFDCIPSFWDSTNGYVVQCRDLMFSHSGGRRGVCSYHGGAYRPLYKH